MTLEMDLERAINRNSAENGSNTPDFVLAAFLAQCLTAFDEGVKEREKWYGRADSPGTSSSIESRAVVASEWQDGDLRFETVDAPLTVGDVDFGDLNEEGWVCVLDHKTDEIVAAFPSSRDGLTYTARLNQALGAQLVSDVRLALDIAKRAAAVERERCLSEVEALYVEFALQEDDGDKAALTSDVARIALVNVGISIAGGDAGPHSDAALAWRARVVGGAVTT